MTTLFHAAPIPLAPGSIIQPGNWGRILRHFAGKHSAWRREIELESLRAESFPGKPSRFEACFACPDEERLRAFAQQMAPINSAAIPPVLYEVEAIDVDADQHLGDWNAVEPHLGSADTFRENAKRYWTATEWHSVSGRPDFRCAEIVTASPLRVLRRLD